MRTKTATTPEVTTDQLEGLDFQYVCEIKLAVFAWGKVFEIKPCDEPAKWAGNYPCCGHLAILCDTHLHHRKTTFRCEPCDREFHDLIGVRPL